MLRGSIVAVVTPFKNDQIDEAKLKELVEFHIENGTNALLPCGTTGESPTLTHEEHDRVVEICIKAAKKRIPIMAGTGSNSTDEAVILTKHASQAGADAALVVGPYYNKPSQEGMFLHFKKVADSVKIPIYIYNIPGRTGKNIEPETIARLAQSCKNIVGVKEASGSLEQMQQIRMLCPKSFLILSGDDSLTLPILSIGGVGVISVVANIVPADVVRLVQLFDKGQLAQAQELHYKMLPLCKAMFIDANPVPVKQAMELMGLCSGDVRLPLCRMKEAQVEQVKLALEQYGLLKGSLC